MPAKLTRRTVVVVVVLAAGLVGVLAPMSPAGATTPAGPLQQIVVKMVSGGVNAASVLSPIPVKTRVVSAPQNRYVLTLSASDAAKALARLQGDPRVAYAARVRTMRVADVVPNDPCFPAPGHACPVIPADTQANLVAVNAPQAWTVTKGIGDPAHAVAVIDTGVDTAHPDLQGKVTFAAIFCTVPGEICSNQDVIGHGTHVSGIIGAATDNGIGIAGLGWNTQVYVYKVLDDQNGAGSTADIATAIIAAVQTGFRVINMSLSNGPCSVDPNCGPDPDTQAAVQFAISHGVVVVAAAGNFGSPEPVFPASYPGVLSVAATDNNRSLAFFSEFGPAANIAAPGVDVVSTWSEVASCPSHPGIVVLYCVERGTSMAAPHVAAAAALVRAQFPSLSGPQVATQLRKTAGGLGAGPGISGGFLDVYKAVTSPPAAGIDGYNMAGADGSVYTFGFAPFLGSMRGHQLTQPVVGIAPTGDRAGYWMAAADGGIFSFGDAAFVGSIGGHRLDQPVVGLAGNSTGPPGYWEVASDGGIFAFGGAGFFGSTGGIRLAQPVVGMAANVVDSRGYWMVASDGGIFSFGDAPFLGSTGGVRLFRPVVGMAATRSGKGYWMVASDGGVFCFGDAGFFGSTGGQVLAQPVVGIIPTPSQRGYWLVAADGGIFAFGDAEFFGSLGGLPLPAPVVGGSS
jgi:subtilisin family serine protease